MRHLYLALASASLLLFAQASVRAADEHDRVRRAFEAGEVVGLAGILTRVTSTYGGRVLGIELDDGRRSSRRVPWVYAIKVLTPEGNVLMLQLNAKTMEILNVKGRGAEAARKRR